jgi:hypothetical protein
LSQEGYLRRGGVSRHRRRRARPDEYARAVAGKDELELAAFVGWPETEDGAVRLDDREVKIETLFNRPRVRVLWALAVVDADDRPPGGAAARRRRPAATKAAGPEAEALLMAAGPHADEAAAGEVEDELVDER